MPRPRGEAEVRNVTLSVKVTEATAKALYERAEGEGRMATELHRDALRAFLDPDWRVAAAEVYAGFSADPVAEYVGLNVEREILIAQGADEDELLKPLPPVQTSPKVVHRHKPGPTPVTERYVQGTRMVTLACMICGEVLPERRA